MSGGMGTVDGHSMGDREHVDAAPVVDVCRKQDDEFVTPLDAKGRDVDCSEDATETADGMASPNEANTASVLFSCPLAFLRSRCMLLSSCCSAIQWQQSHGSCMAMVMMVLVAWMMSCVVQAHASVLLCR